MVEIVNDTFVSPSAVRRRELLKQNGVKQRQKEIAALLSTKSPQKPVHPSTIFIPTQLDLGESTSCTESASTSKCSKRISVLDRAKQFEGVGQRQPAIASDLECDNNSERDSLFVSEDDTISTLSASYVCPVVRHDLSDRNDIHGQTLDEKVTIASRATLVAAAEAKDDHTSESASTLDLTRNCVATVPIRPPAATCTLSIENSRNTGHTSVVPSPCYDENDNCKKRNHHNHPAEQMPRIGGDGTSDVEIHNTDSSTERADSSTVSSIADKIKMFEKRSNPASRLNKDKILSPKPRPTLRNPTTCPSPIAKEPKPDHTPHSLTPKANNSTIGAQFFADNGECLPTQVDKTNEITLASFITSGEDMQVAKSPLEIKKALNGRDHASVESSTSFESENTDNNIIRSKGNLDSISGGMENMTLASIGSENTDNNIIRRKSDSVTMSDPKTAELDYEIAERTYKRASSYDEDRINSSPHSENNGDVVGGDYYVEEHNAHVEATETEETLQKCPPKISLDMDGTEMHDLVFRASEGSIESDDNITEKAKVETLPASIDHSHCTGFPTTPESFGVLIKENSSSEQQYIEAVSVCVSTPIQNCEDDIKKDLPEEMAQLSFFGSTPTSLREPVATGLSEVDNHFTTDFSNPQVLEGDSLREQTHSDKRESVKETVAYEKITNNFEADFSNQNHTHLPSPAVAPGVTKDISIEMGLNTEEEGAAMHSFDREECEFMGCDISTDDMIVTSNVKSECEENVEELLSPHQSIAGRDDTEGSGVSTTDPSSMNGTSDDRTEDFSLEQSSPSFANSSVSDSQEETVLSPPSNRPFDDHILSPSILRMSGSDEAAEKGICSTSDENRNRIRSPVYEASNDVFHQDDWESFKEIVPSDENDITGSMRTSDVECLPNNASWKLNEGCDFDRDSSDNADETIKSCQHRSWGNFDTGIDMDNHKMHLSKTGIHSMRTSQHVDLSSDNNTNQVVENKSEATNTVFTLSTESETSGTRADASASTFCFGATSVALCSLVPTSASADTATEPATAPTPKEKMEGAISDAMESSCDPPCDTQKEKSFDYTDVATISPNASLKDDFTLDELLGIEGTPAPPTPTRAQQTKAKTKHFSSPQQRRWRPRRQQSSPIKAQRDGTPKKSNASAGGNTTLVAKKKKKTPLGKKDLTKMFVFKSGRNVTSGLSVPTPNRFKSRFVQGSKKFSSALTLTTEMASLQLQNREVYQEIGCESGDDVVQQDEAPPPLPDEKTLSEDEKSKSSHDEKSI